MCGSLCIIYLVKIFSKANLLVVCQIMHLKSTIDAKLIYIFNMGGGFQPYSRLIWIYTLIKY